MIRRPQEEVKIPPVEPGVWKFPTRKKPSTTLLSANPENPEEANVLPPSEQPNADAIEALVEEVTAKENAAPAAKTNEIRAESLAAPAKPAEVKTEAEKAPVVPVTAEAAAEKEKPVAGRAEERFRQKQRPSERQLRPNCPRRRLKRPPPPRQSRKQLPKEPGRFS